MLVEFRREEVRAGESWARAADRKAADRRAADRRAAEHEAAGPLTSGSRPVLAVDLSADPLRFRVDEEHTFALRPLTEGDYGALERWINAPHVAKWWDENRTLDQIADYYGPGIRGEDPVRYWVWEVNGRSVGFCQDYRISEHPEYALLCGRPDAIGFDYVIGEAAYVDRGLGTSLLWVFLRDVVVPAYDGATELFAAPDHRNARSLRVLAKLGAAQGLWFDEPQPGGRVDTVVGCSIDVLRVLG